MFAIEISEELSARKNARISAFCIFLTIKHLPVYHHLLLVFKYSETP
ncbi:hypothetical protein HMPREF9151_00289 [Hoylesella saccharolytica F0055]|uniref:Uncharacterized protein n=1 Tax=Hoylesella saccharolytica F0055 TaxID=1127699 RepID=L1NKC6_9BACT|nr:hypothetical protein HMPREF9151_00289 [Hoylesella saccharolytica F0055]